MKYDNQDFDISAQEQFLMGLHKTAVAGEDLLQESIFVESIEPEPEPEEVIEEAEEAAAVAREPQSEPESEPQREHPKEPQKEPELPTAAAPLQRREPVRSEIIYNDVNLTYIHEKETAKIYIEEDVLVPDVQPDLAKILLMEGSVTLNEKEIRTGSVGEDSIRVSGEIHLRTVYSPMAQEGRETVCSINSRLPFRTDWTVKAAANSIVRISATIKSIDYTVINERKFRVKVTLMLKLCEYTKAELKFFEGIKGESLQRLKESFSATDVTEQRRQTLDIKEELLLPENAEAPDKLLDYGISIVCSHKQLSDGKAVIGATLYCNILYMTAEGPKFFQGNGEVTAFVPIENTVGAESSRVSFDASGLNVKIKPDEQETEDDEDREGFLIEGELEICVELFNNIETEIVTDVYHDEKSLLYDCETISTMSVTGNNFAETSVREIINVPEEYGEVGEVLYVTGSIEECDELAEAGKGIVSGTAKFSVLCSCGDENKQYFVLKQDVPFRVSIDMPSLTADMELQSSAVLKNIWFDKINSKQVEINAGIVATGLAYAQNEYCIIKNLSYLEESAEEQALPVIVLYIVKPGDTLWKIAKQFKTTVDAIKEVNELEDDEIRVGSKLLIVR